MRSERRSGRTGRHVRELGVAEVVGVGAGGLRDERDLLCALGVQLVMAGGRKGRRKPGQDEPGENQAARADARARRGGQSGPGPDGGDAEADQWLSPFRIGRPVTPVISNRGGQAAPSQQGWHNPAPAQVWHGADGHQVWHEPVQVPQYGPGHDWREPPSPPGEHRGQQPWHEAEVPPPGAPGHQGLRAQPGQYIVGPPSYGPDPGYAQRPGDYQGGHGHGARDGYGPAAAAMRGQRAPGPRDAPAQQDDYEPGPPPGLVAGSRSAYRQLPPATSGFPQQGIPDGPGWRDGPDSGSGPEYPSENAYRQAGYPVREYGPPGAFDHRGANGGKAVGRGNGNRPPNGYRPASGYASPNGPAPPDGYGGPAGYGPQYGYGPPDRYSGPDSYDRHAEYPRADGYNRQAGYGAPAGYGPPGSYEGLGSHDGPGGYGPPDGYRPPDGYGPPRGYAQPAGYAPPGSYAPPGGNRERDGRPGRGPSGPPPNYGPAPGGPAPGEFRRDAYRPADGYGPGGQYGPRGDYQPHESSGPMTGERRHPGRPASRSDQPGPGVAPLPGAAERGPGPGYGPADPSWQPRSPAGRPWRGPATGGTGPQANDPIGDPRERPRWQDNGQPWNPRDRPEHRGRPPAPHARGDTAGQVSRPAQPRSPAALPPGPSAGLPHGPSAAMAPGPFEGGPGEADGPAGEPRAHSMPSPRGQVSPGPVSPLPPSSGPIMPSPTGTAPSGTRAAASQVTEAGPDDDTAPLPVILHGPAASARTGSGELPPAQPAAPEHPDSSQLQHVRGPFESAGNGLRPSATDVWTPAPKPGATAPPDVTPPEGAAKMDRIKDLYLTAEAIGEDALSTHFEQVSERQRQLIRDYFDRNGGRPEGSEPS
jgi:hypothetical protein